MGNSDHSQGSRSPEGPREAGPSERAAVVLCSGLEPEQASRVSVLLLSMGIEPDIVQRGTGVPGEDRGAGAAGVEIRVSVGDAASARALLREEFPYGFDPPTERPSPISPQADPLVRAPSGWFGRGGRVVLVIAAACAAVFAYAYVGLDGGSRTRLLDGGAASYIHVQQGQYWRLASAIFLHFGFVHLLTNMAALLVLGPPLAHLVGARRFLVIFLLSGIAGNVLSHEMTPTIGLKAGASGAIAGVLGALGGQALRPRPTRYKNWQILGALAAVYGLLIGFGEGRDNTAHLGGFLAGVLLGRINPPLPDETPPVASPEAPRPPRPA